MIDLNEIKQDENGSTDTQTPFFKLKGDKVVIQLVDDMVTESKCIWDSREGAAKMRVVEGDTLPQGGNCQGAEVSFEVAFNTSKTNFDAAFENEPYPNTKVRKDLKYNRNVVVDGTLYKYGMPKSLNEALISQLETVITLGQEFTGIFFEITLDRQAQPMKYSVKIVPGVSTPSSSNPTPVVTENANSPITGASDHERVFIKKFKDGNLKGFKTGELVEINRENFVTEYVLCGGEDTRANQLFTDYIFYKKEL